MKRDRFGRPVCRCGTPVHTGYTICYQCKVPYMPAQLREAESIERGQRAFGCVNNTIRVRSGRYFDIANPKPEQFSFGDIAGALSKICRFGGQANHFYSVAEHLIHCTAQAVQDSLPQEVQQAVMLHDATEAFVGDVVKPLKIMLAEYEGIEDRVEAVIGEKFGIDFNRHRSAIRKIDHEMLIAERRKMFTPDKVTWTGENDVRKVDADFQLWMPETAEFTFVRVARSIGINVDL